VRRWRAVLSIPLLALAIAAAAGPDASRAAAQDDQLATKLFTIRFKAVEDVVLLIEPVMSDRGSYTVQPRLKAVTVRDTPANLARIGDLVAGFDQPPRSVRLVIQVLRATEADPATNRRGSESTGITSILKDVTKWSEVSVLGSASIVGVEGGQSTLNIGDEFRVRFRVDTVADRQGVVKFDRFALDRLVHDADGVTRPVPIWDTVVNLRNNQQLLLGATSSQESRRAVFLSLTATIEPAGPVRPAVEN
jgi:type II/III secretion system protein